MAKSTSRRAWARDLGITNSGLASIAHDVEGGGFFLGHTDEDYSFIGRKFTAIL
jgi:hypothetical protein